MRKVINDRHGVAQCILATIYKDGVRDILFAEHFNRTAVMEIYEIQNKD